jgi:hypothetical protein
MTNLYVCIWGKYFFLFFRFLKETKIFFYNFKKPEKTVFTIRVEKWNPVVSTHIVMG